MSFVAPHPPIPAGRIVTAAALTPEEGASTRTFAPGTNAPASCASASASGRLQVLMFPKRSAVIHSFAPALAAGPSKAIPLSMKRLVGWWQNTTSSSS